MTEPASTKDLFKGRHFDQGIIILCIRWYLTFKLSSRDLAQMMAERGIVLAHSTILRWVERYVPDFESVRLTNTRLTPVGFSANFGACQPRSGREFGDPNDRKFAKPRKIEQR
jgi:hypothetical protein